MKTLTLTVIACALLAQAVAQDIRIDTFDKRSNRTGYIIINPNTGRLDQFDKNSRRLGYGTVTSPPSSTPSGESSRSVPPDPRRPAR